ncbi:MAG: LptF/LptG family permease [Pseudomonadota bacterium]
MRRLDIYLLKQCVQVVAGLTALALAVLLLERLLRIFELVSNTSDTMGAAARMLLALIPYYLSLAIPVALFLGVLITVDRVSRTGELSASLAAGVSLFQVARPFLIIAGSLAFLSFLVMGFLNPLGRYDFRATEHRVQQSSFEAAFQEGKFAQIGERVFWTEDRSGGDQLGQVFILEEAHEDINARLTTAPSGRIGRGVLEDETRITLNNGQAITFSPGRTVVERLDFDRSDWNVEGDVLSFRARGDDERELTLPELIQEARGRGNRIVEPHVASSAAHAQLGRSLILVFLPLIALPMGLGYGRSFQSTGIAVGLVFLLLSQKSLEMGQTLAANGQIEPWLGTWPVVGGVALIGLVLFLRSALLVATPPLMLLSFDLEKTVRQIVSSVGARVRSVMSAGNS